MISSICVCGAGTMGSGIAQNTATAGFTTILYELNPDILEAAEKKMQENLQKLVDKGKLSGAEKTAALQRIRYTCSIEECTAEVIIEAIIEKPEIKISLFNRLAEINKADTIFASNTSSLSVQAMANQVNFPDRLLGMHFFNPAPLMKLVEVVTTDKTSSTARNTILELAKDMGKTAVLCKDSPGFIVNRVARPFYIESLRLAEKNIPFESIDAALENAGFKMGPFRLMDLIGNDVNYAVSVSLHEQLNKPDRLLPSYIQKEKVEKGELGRKTGKGYYFYDKA